MEGKKKDWWFRGIAFISILYFVAVWSILVMNLWYSPPSPKLGLNEIGDYLAGAFSPLAFFWLAYGYWMQNKELKNQIIEFKENLNFQKTVNQKKEEREKIESKPILHIKDKNNELETINEIIIKNKFNIPLSSDERKHYKPNKKSETEIINSIKNKKKELFDSEEAIVIDIEITCIKSEIYNITFINFYKQPEKIITNRVISRDKNKKRNTEKNYKKQKEKIETKIIREGETFTLNLAISKSYISKLLNQEALLIPFYFTNIRREISYKTIIIGSSFLNISMTLEDITEDQICQLEKSRPVTKSASA